MEIKSQFTADNSKPYSNVGTLVEPLFGKNGALVFMLEKFQNTVLNAEMDEYFSENKDGNGGNSLTQFSFEKPTASLPWTSAL